MIFHHEDKACDDLGSRAHPTMKKKTVDEMFAAEKGDLYPAGKPFDGYIEKTTSVSGTNLVQYDNNLYSAPAKFAKMRVSLRAYADRIMMISGQITSGRCSRLPSRVRPRTTSVPKTCPSIIFSKTSASTGLVRPISSAPVPNQRLARLC